MKKQFFARALAVVTAMSMLSTTAFAASFADLQDAVNGNDNGTYIEDTDRYCYGWNDEESRYGIEAWEGEDGTRNIQLNEDVERVEGETNKSIVITDEVTIDLNGNDINGKKEESTSALIQVKGPDADLTLKDSTAHTDEETGEYVSGAVTGGNHVKVPGGAAATGGGVSVTGGGSLTLESGAIKGNNANQNGGGVYVENGTAVMDGGLIDGNTAGHGGGGVSLNSTAASMQNGTATFTMNGGTISNNTASGRSETNGSINGAGGAISADRQAQYDIPEGPEIIINGGTITGNEAAVNGGAISASNVNVSINGTDKRVEITDNTAGSDGGGIFVNGSVANVTNAEIIGNEANRGGAIFSQNQATVEVDSTNITDNTALSYGGGIAGYNKADINVTDSDITENTANKVGGGIFLNTNSITSVDADSKVYNNAAGTHSDDIYANSSTLKLPTAGSMGVTGADGKPVTGWYYDGTDRYGNGDKAYLAQNNATTENGYKGILCLKAAHDQYFTLSDGNDKELANVEKGTTVDLVNDIEAPVREGWEFIGWANEAGEIVTTVKVVKDTTLTAQWTHNADAHNYVETVTTEATCTTAGVTTYTCADCGATYTEEIAAAGHTAGEAVRENEVAAQPGVAGSYVEVTYCTVCGEEISRTTVTIPALPVQPTPDTPDTPDDPDEPDTPDVPGTDIPEPGVPGADEPADDADDEAATIAIEDENVPLAGIMTLADLLEALRQHEGVADVELPEDFAFIDHTYAQAIYWGLAEGLVVDTEDEPLDPDAIVNVGLLRTVLANFVEIYKEEDLVIDIEGEDDELVLDLGDRLNVFYEELSSAR